MYKTRWQLLDAHPDNIAGLHETWSYLDLLAYVDMLWKVCVLFINYAVIFLWGSPLAVLSFSASANVARVFLWYLALRGKGCQYGQEILPFPNIALSTAEILFIGSVDGGQIANKF